MELIPTVQKYLADTLKKYADNGTVITIAIRHNGRHPIYVLLKDYKYDKQLDFYELIGMKPWQDMLGRKERIDMFLDLVFEKLSARIEGNPTKENLSVMLRMNGTEIPELVIYNKDEPKGKIKWEDIFIEG